MLIKVAIAAVLVWWLFIRKKSPESGVIQPEGQPDFDPVTADQLNGAATGDVSIGDEWSATFTQGNGNWSDAYKSHSQVDDSGMFAAGAGGA